MLAIFVLFIIVTLSQIVLGSLLWIESSRSKRKDQRLFVGVLIATLLWTFCNAGLSFIDTAADQSNLYLFDLLNKGGFVMGVITLLSIFLFSFYYPVTKKIQKYQKLIMIVGLGAAIIAPLKVVSGSFSFNAGKVVYQPGALSVLIGILALVIIASIIISNFKLFFNKNTDLKLKRQTITLLSGFALMVIHAVIFIIVLPEIVGQNTWIYIIGYLAPYYFIFLVIYGLLRQGLFDVRLVVARTLGYVLSITSLAIVYGVLAFSIIDTFILNLSKGWQQAVYTALAVFLAFTFQPLKRFFDRWSNKLFYQDAYDPQELLDTLNKVLVSTIELDKLLSNSSDVISKAIKAEFCLFGIKEVGGAPQRIIGTKDKHFDKEDISAVRAFTPSLKVKTIVTDELQDDKQKLHDLLRKNDIAVMLRLTKTPTKQEEGIGYLILGNKKSGSPYSHQDIKVLEIIADAMVIAIQNALRFEEIQNFNVTLQDKVDDATGKLRSANKRLIELDQTKDDFISMASHQLRTPLTSIKGYVSMVIEGDAGKITKNQTELLGRAFTSSQQMVYLIADLLNVSRLRTGKFVIDRKETNLSDVIDGEINQLKETAKTRNIELSYDKPKNFPVLMLDETKTRQVIMNFIDNAIYYTPAGGHIKVVLQDNGEAIEFSVTDDGIGVPKSEQHNLFTKFYRAGNAKKARPDGTGLGLFMAKKVIAAQGGSIVFDSKENKGSTFGFNFTKKPLLPTTLKDADAAKGKA